VQDPSFHSLVRPPAVAGLFYPGDAAELRTSVATLLAAAHAEGRAAAPAGAGAAARVPKALILPHAGYVYSGAIAATGYGALGGAARPLRRVLLLGPSHRVWLRGLAVPAAQVFATPLGEIPVDTDAVDVLRALPAVAVADAPHAREHSLEVHLPFLQQLAPQARIVPVVAGDATPEEVAAVIDALWDGPETLIIVSSDLSHYQPYASACAADRATAQAILAGREDLRGEQACGAVLINGLAHAAHRRRLHVTVLDLRNSGDTAGDHRRVVGYGAFGYYDA
jgi:AmmeMemoRadiSam system protein B